MRSSSWQAGSAEVVGAITCRARGHSSRPAPRQRSGASDASRTVRVAIRYATRRSRMSCGCIDAASTSPARPSRVGALAQLPSPASRVRTTRSAGTSDPARNCSSVSCPCSPHNICRSVDSDVLIRLRRHCAGFVAICCAASSIGRRGSFRFSDSRGVPNGRSLSTMDGVARATDGRVRKACHRRQCRRNLLRRPLR